MDDKSLNPRERIILTFFIVLLLSLVIIAKFSDVKADKETAKVLEGAL